MTWKAGSKKVALRVAGTSTKLSFTAKYTDTVKRVRIVFAPNGGRVSSGSKTVICGKTYGALPTPARRGYTFAGWWTAVDSGEQINAESVVKTASDHVLYAHWVLNSVSVSYQTHVANIGWQNEDCSLRQ